MGSYSGGYHGLMARLDAERPKPTIEEATIGLEKLMQVAIDKPTPRNVVYPDLREITIVA